MCVGACGGIPGTWSWPSQCSARQAVCKDVKTAQTGPRPSQICHRHMPHHHTHNTNTKCPNSATAPQNNNTNEHIKRPSFIILLAFEVRYCRTTVLSYYGTLILVRYFTMSGSPPLTAHCTPGAGRGLLVTSDQINQLLATTCNSDKPYIIIICHHCLTARTPSLVARCPPTCFINLCTSGGTA